MKPIRVAIVGGGCAGTTAAFELTRPEHGGRYEVTLYQEGWRLGGKGASGRGPNGRIEEHGLHVWMGFYENAFGLMRDAYAELARDPATCPIARWSDAFSPAREIGVAAMPRAGEWSVWSTVFPALAGEPGAPFEAGPDGDRSHPFSLRGYLHRISEVMLALFQLACGPSSSAAEPAPSELERGARGAFIAGLGWIDAHVAMLQNQLLTLSRILRESGIDAGASLASIVGDIVRALDAIRLRSVGDDHRQRAAEVLEVLAVSVVGAFRAGVFRDPEGFDALDGYDFREFLRESGASDAAVDSPFVRGLYSLMFAYEGGDPSRPRTAAGQALRGCLRMFFTYRGSLFWKMAAGMGDVVFAPLYEVLERRGVRFEFFHRLTDVGLSASDEAGGRHVSRLDFAVQAKPMGRYRPLVDVEGVPSWPSAPDWTQLEGGDRQRAEGWRFEASDDARRVGACSVEVGRDFDLVVLAIGLGEVPVACRSILEVDPRWRRMVEKVGTVATAAMQLWLSEPMDALGWTKGPVTITAFAPPFDTWADMTHLIERERWPADRAPRAIAYFCNVLDERHLASEGRTDAAHGIAERLGRAFAVEHLPGLWPGIVDGGGRLRPEAFLDHRTGAESSAGGHPLAGQYFRANTSRSERYTLSLPGTPQYRISPLDRTYDNLAVAGDWTACGLALGCVESAVMSGRLAAHAISGRPALADIVGYDHL